MTDEELRSIELNKSYDAGVCKGDEEGFSRGFEEGEKSCEEGHEELKEDWDNEAYPTVHAEGVDDGKRDRQEEIIAELLKEAKHFDLISREDEAKTLRLAVEIIEEMG